MAEKVALAHGDGIGPEISEAVVEILTASKVELEYLDLPIGLEAYEAGHSGGIPEEAWEMISKADAILKAPITTPSGGGVKSLNVTLRKRLGLAVNLRPAQAYAPYVETHYPGMDLVIVRENEEDLYAGIEYQQSRQSVHAIKLITRPGCERVIRYAFDYALASGREKVTALIKDNIMKMSDGLFYQVFEEIGAEYPDIEKERMIVDIGMARIADTPEHFEVVVCENLYGDILSDITAQLSGSVGLCGSANLGEGAAMFEAIHGSAPDIAGQGQANPSGMLRGATMMLQYLGHREQAELIDNAWLRTLEDGIHTPDLKSSHSKKVVGSREFTHQLIARLGENPRRLARAQAGSMPPVVAAPQARGGERSLRGVDIFMHHHESIDELSTALQAASETAKLSAISCRGSEVWPKNHGSPLLTDRLAARFLSSQEVDQAEIIRLMENITSGGVEIVGSENLYYLDGNPGFSALQGD